VSEPPAASPLPQALLAGLQRVDDPLLAGRYREALAALGVRAPALGAFHVDAAGYSPELAEALGDPGYLGTGPLEARAIWVGAAQLAGPLVHPGLGFAAEALRRFAAARERELAELLLREALIVEIAPEGPPVAEPGALADPERVELRVRTPSGLVEAARRLDALGREFLASDERWLDDDFIGVLLDLAKRVRGLPALAPGFEQESHRLAPFFFSPAFGGAYLVEEPGASAAHAATFVLAAEAGAPRGGGARRSARGRRLELRPLAADEALGVLEAHHIARVDLASWRARPAALERMRERLALEVRLARAPERPPDRLGPHEVAEALGDASALEPLDRELEEVTRRILGGRGGVDPASLAPANRLRLAVPTTTRPPVVAFVRHLQAFLDPQDSELAWRAAPDLFFARLPGLSAARRACLAARLEDRDAALEA
jgi:hypothetical protein